MYEDVHVSPMLIGIEKEAFDDRNFIYELKLDGIRVLAYIENGHVDIRNKRGDKLLYKFPELEDMYKQVKQNCILDGELYCFGNGQIDFFELQKRSLLTDKFKIMMASKHHPASFTAFDILYVKEKSLLKTPLLKRKSILSKNVVENHQISISRYVEEQGKALFQLTTQKHLEGIVAKRKDSLYSCGKRTKDWIKCKNMMDEDFVIVGYIRKDKNMVSLVLAQYDDKELLYKGHVTLGVSLSYLQKHSNKTNTCPFPSVPNGNEDAVWISPYLVGCVKFMQHTKNGGMRQPVFKGFREDKTPEECRVDKK